LTGARTVLIKNRLKPESSYNFNVGWQSVYTTSFGVGNWSIEGFYTYFDNKIIPNYDLDANYIVYDNLNGYSISKGLNINLFHSFPIPLTVNIGATYQDVYRIENALKIKQLFTPQWTGTWSVNYDLKKIGLKIDYTGRFVSAQHLPHFEEPFSRPTVSKPYTLQNIQCTKSLKNNIEAYFAIKNLWNWTQQSPLINPQEPFSTTFDTSYVYAPLQTRRLVLGIRWHIDK
jgi:outer membrane receptor for ferrienterochelin and colicins